jgi:hypothetical protein
MGYAALAATHNAQSDFLRRRIGAGRDPTAVPRQA